MYYPELGFLNKESRLYKTFVSMDVCFHHMILYLKQCYPIELNHLLHQLLLQVLLMDPYNIAS